MIPEEIIEQAERALLDATDDLPDDAHVGVTAALEAALPALREWVLETELEQVGVVFSEPSMSGERLRFTSHVRVPQGEHERRVFVLRQEQP